jgi:hypothetical protein
MNSYAAQASRSGGTTVFRRDRRQRVTANFTSAALALLNSDQSSAMAPVTKGAAALVPPNERGLPSVPRLVISWPGALRPCLPTELPRFDSLSGLP